MRTHWTKEEVTYLEDNVGVRTFTNIAQKLGRTENAVAKKAYSLGIGDTRAQAGYYSAYQMSDLLDVDMSVIHKWIERYDFPVRIRSLRKQKGHRVKQNSYHIAPEDFWGWAKKHKELINFSKIDYDSIVPEPDWVNTERRKDYETIPKRSRQKWTSYEDNQLIQFNQLGWSYEDMGRKLNRSEKACMKRLERLRTKGGIEMKQRHVQKNWVEEEVQALLLLRQQGLSWSKIGEKMGRSAGSVRDKWERTTRCT